MIKTIWGKCTECNSWSIDNKCPLFENEKVVGCIVGRVEDTLK